MPKVHRNDPCPCGSGRKYKNCHMQQDRIDASRDLSLNVGEGYLWNGLYQYAQSPRFAGSLVEGFRLYWGGAFDLRGGAKLDSDDVRRMFEWFIHDFHTSTDNRYIIDLYRETQAADLPPDLAQVLDAWSQSAMGVFRITELGTEQHMVLYDPLREESLTIQSPTWSRNAQVGDLLIGRKYTLDGAKHLSYMTIALPQAFEQDLVAYVANAYHLFRDKHMDATWGEFLREEGHIFHAFLLSPRAEPFRSLIGPGTRYHDPAIGRDRLREFTERALAEERRKRMREEEPPRRERRTGSGLILPGREEEPEQEGEGERPARPTILIPGRDT